MNATAPRRTRRKPVCTFCDDTFVLNIAGHVMVCPIHRELHDEQGLPRVSVEQAAEIGVKIAADRAEVRGGMTAAGWMFLASVFAIVIFGLLWVIASLVGGAR